MKCIDLMNFFIIILTFMISFGISLQAILFPKDSFSWSIFREILNIAYWPIYGEISILERINNETCFESGSIEPPCLDDLSFFSSYTLLMIYMIFASVLLINLLIAMFRYVERELFYI